MYILNTCLTVFEKRKTAFWRTKMRTDNYLQKVQQTGLQVGGLYIDFQRTTRVPEGKVSGLPAGLGSFPVYRVKDFLTSAPKEWNENAFFMPMYEQEAMWMNFSRNSNPKALIVAAGNINSITGKPFSSGTGLDIKLEKEQNYIVT